jgi:formylglycine-generating enzyme required for sulfatase activity
MRHVSRALVALALVGAAPHFACANRKNVQCEVDANCDLTTGGICAVANTGNHWCAYYDSHCPSGYRFSDQDVGDGVSGTCVAPADAGVPPDTSAPPPASCVGLPATCGSNGNDDCCNSPAIAAGSYDRSYDVAGDTHSGDTSAPATISAFRLDKYEVTVGRFRAFVAAGMGTQASPPPPGAGSHPTISGSGWDANWNTYLPENTTALLASIKCIPFVFPTWTDLPAATEHRPMNCISWYLAMAFCAWDGGFLPTEAEWNYAAAGGDQQRAYPWSIPAGLLSIDPSYASYGDGRNNGIGCLGDGMPDCTVGDLVAVGSKPSGDGRWRHSDLAGNVWEWTLDMYSPTYTTPCTNCACLDCPNVIAGKERVIRGGGYANAPEGVRTGYRFGILPSDTVDDVGVRCTRRIP